jgi:hypothetical protein
MSSVFAIGLARLALSARNLLATVTPIAILAAMAPRFTRRPDRTALLTAAALVAIGLGCGPEETADPVTTTLGESKPAPDRARPAAGAANREKPVTTSAPAVRDRVPDAAPYSATDARSDRMEPASDAHINEQAQLDVHVNEQAQLLSDLDSPDPDARVDAADWIDLEGEALERMISLLESDPDPVVRATIVDRLGEEITATTLAALVNALRDRDPEVVLQAIDVLEFEAEDWLIPELEPLLAHSDPEVREAAQDAIEYLE